LCRRDHGISWDEFQELTLAHIEALEERRAIEIRYARYDALTVACAMVGGNPLDYLPGYEQTPEELERRDIKMGIIAALMRLPVNTTQEEVDVLRKRIVERLKANGRTDAEEIMNEVSNHA
jgi:hypothetical protein